ncbi:hypothetical protein [Paraburkholderia sp. J94]|nr:hypothetical protein [Paraburkholderia sp. J94]
MSNANAELKVGDLDLTLADLCVDGALALGAEIEGRVKQRTLIE